MYLYLLALIHKRKYNYNTKIYNLIYDFNKFNFILIIKLLTY